MLLSSSLRLPRLRMCGGRTVNLMEPRCEIREQTRSEISCQQTLSAEYGEIILYNYNKGFTVNKQAAKYIVLGRYLR